MTKRRKNGRGEETAAPETDPREGREVAKIPPPRKNVTVRGTRPRVVESAEPPSRGRPKFAVTGTGSGMGRSKVAFPATGNTMGASAGNFYSPQLSTDFLELPQSTDEKRNFFRFFYDNEPFVGQAIDLHTELPLSKVRLAVPKARDTVLAQKAYDFCLDWSNRIGLLHRLIEIVHEYNLLGEAYVFAEDSSPDLPRSETHETRNVLNALGEPVEEEVLRPDALARAERWLRRNYTGWTAIRTFPPEQMHVETFSFTDEKLIEMIPDSKTKDIIEKAAQGDERAMFIVQSLPIEVVRAVRAGENIPLNTDPFAGSFIHFLARKKSQYEARGKSMLERCMHTLVYRDKLRQSQTQIASRHMTPIRVITAIDASAPDLDAIREQVDMALMDPDYSIITNFEVTWEEMGSSQRLLELGSEYELTDRQLYAGLGVTESLLSGESSYSGDRINLEVINTRFMLLREVLQNMVEEKFFRPMCRKMGFVEEDEYGVVREIVPSLSFTRLALRDNADTFDHLLNLYQKGSVDVSVLLELLNLDPLTTANNLRRDVMTLNDATFNEILRAAYGAVGSTLAEKTDMLERVAKLLGLAVKPDAPEEGRY